MSPIDISIIRNGCRSLPRDDMRETILALCADVERLNAAIVRQAGAAKTLRECTLAEVQHLKDKDRSEYHAAASLDSERLANKILTDESDKLRAENDRLTAERVSLIQAAKDVGASFRKALDRAEKAEAENERLRNALVEIAHTFTERSDGTIKTYSASFYQEVARAAIAQKGGE